MRIGTIPSNPIEKLLNAANLLPTPLMETHMAMLLARTIMAGSALGVFAANYWPLSNNEPFCMAALILDSP